MKIHMTFRHMDATDALKAQVNEKSEKLKHFMPEAAEVTWICYVEADLHVADLRVKGPHIDYFAQAKTDNLYRSMDEVTDKVERQLKKHKEQVKDHIHRDRS